MLLSKLNIVEKYHTFPKFHLLKLNGTGSLFTGYLLFTWLQHVLKFPTQILYWLMELLIQLEIINYTQLLLAFLTKEHIFDKHVPYAVHTGSSEKTTESVESESSDEDEDEDEKEDEDMMIAGLFQQKRKQESSNKSKVCLPYY